MAFAATRSIASVQGLSAKKVQGSKARVAAVRCVSEETPAVFSTRRSALSLIATVRAGGEKHAHAHPIRLPRATCPHPPSPTSPTP